MTELRQPINDVQWVDVDELHANDYNPNSQTSVAMDLLKTSILEDGWTQPIVARADGEIVDGFHRWTLAKDNADVAVDGKVPVVMLKAAHGRAEQMMSTVRHNRARGHHGVLPMADIVENLIDSGVSAYDVQQRLGMSPEEFERLYERGVLARNGFDDWSKGWEPAFRTDLEEEAAAQ